MAFTRRDFGKAALASAALSMGGARMLSASVKTDATVRGVKLGSITGAFGPFPTTEGQDVVDVVIKSAIEASAGYVELVNTRIMEPAMGGSCTTPFKAPAGAEGGTFQPPCGNGGQVPKVNPAADYPTEREKLRQWRLTAPLDKFKAAKQKFDAAGLDLYSYVMTIGDDFTDPEIEAVFKQMQALGVKRFCTNQSRITMGPRMAPFAKKYNIIAAWHNHQLVDDPKECATPESFEKLFAMSPMFKANLDMGWFYKGGNDPFEFLKKHHARVSHMHVRDCKDRTTWADIGTGVVPIADMLKYVRDNKYDVGFIIEQNGRTGAKNNVEAIKQDLDWMKSVLLA